MDGGFYHQKLDVVDSDGIFWTGFLSEIEHFIFDGKIYLILAIKAKSDGIPAF